MFKLKSPLCIKVDIDGHSSPSCGTMSIKLDKSLPLAEQVAQLETFAQQQQQKILKLEDSLDSLMHILARN